MTNPRRRWRHTFQQDALYREHASGIMLSTRSSPAVPSHALLRANVTLGASPSTTWPVRVAVSWILLVVMGVARGIGLNKWTVFITSLNVKRLKTVLAFHSFVALEVWQKEFSWSYARQKLIYEQFQLKNMSLKLHLFSQHMHVFTFINMHLNSWLFQIWLLVFKY